MVRSELQRLYNECSFGSEFVFTTPEGILQQVEPAVLSLPGFQHQPGQRGIAGPCRKEFAFKQYQMFCQILRRSLTGFFFLNEAVQ